MGVDYTVERIYNEMIGKVTSSQDVWKKLLRLNGQLYRYEFDNILMVYAQRPGATLVADYDTWKKVGRYVRRGSKGIAIFPSRALKPYMRHVFDIGDMGGRSREDAGAGCGAADQRQHTLCRVYQVRAGGPAGGAGLRDHRGPERSGCGPCARHICKQFCLYRAVGYQPRDPAD